jgi:hypothetical protein
MKKTYVKPTLTKGPQLSIITATICVSRTVNCN